MKKHGMPKLVPKSRKRGKTVHESPLDETKKKGRPLRRTWQRETMLLRRSLEDQRAHIYHLQEKIFSLVEASRSLMNSVHYQGEELESMRARLVKKIPFGEKEDALSGIRKELILDSEEEWKDLGYDIPLTARAVRMPASQTKSSS